ncbi:MAG: helix-turn-helix domain-containing protein [Clostridia bacterium]|nr:helix-turn-helix domain-containing protein [Clostridia bacterium]
MNAKNNLNTNMFANYDDVVGVKDLQKMLGMGRNLAYDLIKENKIKHFKIKNRIFIPKQYIINFLLDCEVNDER